MSKILVIIPTYNERETIGIVIDSLDKNVFPKLPQHKFEILVVDDTSPDETYLVVKEKMKRMSNLNLLLNKEKEGIGAAYIKGFKYAIDIKCDYAAEMDADLQHSPNDLVRLVKDGVDEGYDCVIGSRFIHGGSSEGLNTFRRRFLSRLGTFILRVSLGLYKYQDITTGFKITKVKGILDKIKLDKIYSKSYAYKIHIFYQIVSLGAKIIEVPIAFGLREKGWSKMDSEDIFESLKVIYMIRRDNIRKRIGKN